uniref:Uncharacterized protein n=1 Tax=Arundo donax TaxID=35708 RepID=A0A0A8Y6U5_ARUDO
MSMLKIRTHFLTPELRREANWSRNFGCRILDNMTGSRHLIE